MGRIANFKKTGHFAQIINVIMIKPWNWFIKRKKHLWSFLKNWMSLYFSLTHGWFVPIHGWNWLSGSQWRRRCFLIMKGISVFSRYLLMDFIWRNLNPLYPRMLCFCLPRLVEFGLVVLKKFWVKNVKCLKTSRQIRNF